MIYNTLSSLIITHQISSKGLQDLSSNSDLHLSVIFVVYVTSYIGL